MEPYEKCIRRHSHSILHDLLKSLRDDLQEQSHPGRRRSDKSLSPVLRYPSLNGISARKGSLLHLDGNGGAVVCRANDSKQAALSGQSRDLYLPTIAGKMSNLQAARTKLSHSCPYLYTSRRRGSVSSISSLRAPDFSHRQNSLKAQKEAKKSNVTVTMMYLGTGYSSNSQDDLKVLQQICGGENICVFKGLVQSREEFQFTSQRHLGFPFSASVFVNGIMAARISSCCEYRYAPGFQQGRKSCFRMTRLHGGKPCYRCVNSRHGIGTPSIISPAPVFQPAAISNESDTESRASSPLFLPVGMDKTIPKTRNLSKDAGALSTDSEDMNDKAKEKRRRRRRSQSEVSKSVEQSGAKTKLFPGNEADARLTFNTPKDQENVPSTDKTKVAGLLQEGRTQTKPDGQKAVDPPERNKNSRNRGRLRDFYEECVEMSTGLESGLDQQRWFKANKFERDKIKEQLTSGHHAKDSASDVELSAESDSNEMHGEARRMKVSNTHPNKENDAKQQDIQKQMEAVSEVLSSSDEVEQLIMRNTGLTDKLLMNLAESLKRSPSRVKVMNLNLNQIGPPGASVLLDLVQAKAEIEQLLLFGNQLGDLGAQVLLAGLADIQEKTAAVDGNAEQRNNSPAIKELDLGGNGIGSIGLRVLATFMRHHSNLEYLGLAQTPCSDQDAWVDFFESLKANTMLTHIILDESGLGDDGIKLFADVLRSNKNLTKVDLDNNGFGDVGGSYLLDALKSQERCSLTYLSLEGNYISTELMGRIEREVASNKAAAL